MRIALSALGLLLIFGAVAYLTLRLTSKPDAGTATRNKPIRGIACSDLREAQDASSHGAKSFEAAVGAAEASALRALNEDGILFGRPEAIAMELAELVLRQDATRSSTEVQGLLDSGVAACPA